MNIKKDTVFCLLPEFPSPRAMLSIILWLSCVARFSLKRNIYGTHSLETKSAFPFLLQTRQATVVNEIALLKMTPYYAYN